MLDEIRAGLATSDAKRVERGAHTLRGSADIFAARRVVEAALNLENMSREGELQAGPDALRKLEEEITSLSLAIKAAINVD